MNYQVRNFITNHNLLPGDAIVAKKVGYRVLDHFIVYLGNTYNGSLFMANSTEDGVRKYSEDEVLELVKLFDPVRIRRLNGCQRDRNLAEQRALGLEGEPYSLFENNCEHFANYVQNGRKESPQVGFWLLAVIIALVVAITSFGKR